MTETLAMEYIPRRMCELGHGKNYMIRFRHLLLKPAEIRMLAAHNQLYLLIEPATDVRIESSTGVFNVNDALVNEVQYEHRGDIKITNLATSTRHLKMIQVIPKNCETPCP